MNIFSGFCSEGSRREISSRQGLLTFVIVCLVSASFSAPQGQFRRLSFERISMEHGLSQSIVRTVVQDSEGFLWIGTQDGLNRYDGYQFTIYKYNPHDSTSISHTDINFIYESPAEPHTMWIGTSRGLNRFDKETGRFTRYLNAPNDPTSLSNDFVWYIYEDTAGDIWVCTADGGGAVDRLDRKTGTFTRYRHHPDQPNSLSNSLIRFNDSVFEDHAGTMWIGTAYGLNRFDRSTGSFERFLHDPDDSNSISFDAITAVHESMQEPNVLWIGTGDPQNLKGGGLNRLDVATGKITHYRHNPSSPTSIGSDFVSPIQETNDGTIWLGTAHGLDRFDRASGTFKNYLPNPGTANALANVVNFIFEDSRGMLWILTQTFDGVHRFNPTTGVFESYCNDPENPHSMSNDGVMSIFEDRSGVLWFGTNLGGLSKLDYYGRRFKTYRPEPNNPNSLSNRVVRALCEDHAGALWVGVAGGGLNKLDRATETFAHYRNNPNDANSLSNDNVWALHEDARQRLWVGTLGAGLDLFVRANEKFKNYRHDPYNPNSLSNDNVRVIHESLAEPGVLWIGTDGGGLSRFDTDSGNFKNYQSIPGDASSLSNNVVRAIGEDSDGNLWLGTVGGGLNKFDRHSETFVSYQHESGNPNSLSHNFVQGIHLDDRGMIWAGTFGGGLSCFDPASGKFKVFTEQNSDLPNNVVYGILEDGHGNLWLSTNGGVCKFNPKTNTTKMYDVDDGLQDREFNGQAFFKNRRGEMFFGGINGFNAFHPDSVKDNPFAPQLALTDFKIFNESVGIGGESPLKKHISYADTITLAYWQNDISIDFVALHYSRPAKNEYAYLLENYDSEWRHAGTQRTATYTNLDPGHYIFRVKGSNGDGVWNEQALSLNLIIHPPFWRTWWAYGVYAIMLVAILFGLRRFEVSRERDKARIRESELRAQAAEAQARAVQAENERKSHELEQARKLQLAMLPKAVPQVPNFDIAVYMQTATEVGGDYYDFKLEDDGTLTAAIGDATGHGLQAGTMVAATKSLFNSLAHLPHPVPILTETSHALRGMGFHNMYMAMTIAKFQQNHMRLAAAGMPYTLIYRAKSRSVEEVVIKGLPLGSFVEVDYQWKQLDLDAGDAVLFMSDGFTEMFNDKSEVMGEECASKRFQEVGHKSPEQIIEHLVRAGKTWANGQPQNDDVTFLVLKMK